MVPSVELIMKNVSNPVLIITT